MDILQQSPELQYKMLDLGELAPGGRDAVKMEFTHTGIRRRLVVSVMVRKGDDISYVKETSFNVGADTQTVRTLPYQIKSSGPQTLMIVVRDEKTSAVLMDLKSDFVAPGERGAGDPGGRGSGGGEVGARRRNGPPQRRKERKDSQRNPFRLRRGDG